MKKRLLILEDGTVFQGQAFGSDSASQGEVVFTTGMTGYQETLSDPSFYGQIITFTYPSIGNYGINRDDFESLNPVIKGLAVREWARNPSNFRASRTLDDCLTAKGIPGIEGIDTRKLTRLLRSKGLLRAVLTAAERQVNVEEIIEQLQAAPRNRNQVPEVSTKRAYPSPGRGKRIVLIDFGMKHGILRELNKRDCDVIIVPHDTTAEEILAMQPDGVMLSNGPGNPEHVQEGIETVRKLLGNVPLFGICLGHQLLALACGATISKLPFGHRGANHPVKDVRSGRTELTSQNHDYAVDQKSLSATDLEVTHLALNDGTVEGIQHRTYPVFGVQFHPEASPGPMDANHLFNDFIKITEKTREELQHA